VGKSILGECRICGEVTKLTFEHVPPESAFNKKGLKIISTNELIKTITEPNREPWNFEGLKYRQQQKGSGGYYLCESCNSKTGKWYVPFYLDFLYGFRSVLKLPELKAEEILQVSAKSFRPLAVFKQIMTMFCDINHFCPSDEKLKAFLLDKNCTEFDCNKYRIFMYVFAGGIQRIHSIAGMLIGNVGLLLSEIVSPPLGFVLYIDLPERLPPYIQLPGCEITEFCHYNYDDVRDASFILPIHECNIYFPADFRTKSELRQSTDEDKAEND
jgi:hypothetical protein